jgi:hypothetical protein
MRRPIAGALLCALIVVSGASAKAPPDLQLCGATACTPLAATGAEVVAISIFYGDARVVAPPIAAPSDFYALRWRFPDQAPGLAYYVPSAGVVRMATASPGSYAAAGMWLRPNANVLEALSAVSVPLEGIRPAVPTRVTVAGRPARDPASYVRIWTLGKPAIPVHPRGWLFVRMTTPTASPWSDSATDVRVSRRGGWLYRDGTFFRVPAKFAARMRASVASLAGAGETCLNVTGPGDCPPTGLSLPRDCP